MHRSSSILQQDLTDQAMGLVFYDQFTPERAQAWLAWRESISDPEHTLNKSPLMTLMVLEKWLGSAPERLNTFLAKRWTQQVLNACALWQWPANSTSTELYYRLGHMLDAPGRLDFLDSVDFADEHLENLLVWCELLEDYVRPKLSASIRYQLQDNGVLLLAPQEAVLNAICARVLNQQTTSPGMDILWCSPKARRDEQYANALSRCAPYSLPAAIKRSMLQGDLFEKSASCLAIHASVFRMNPGQSDPAKLLDALTLSYGFVSKAKVAPYAQAVWDTISRVWPAYSGLLHATVMMNGAESLLQPTRPQRSALIGHIQNIQTGHMPSTLALDGMFDIQDV